MDSSIIVTSIFLILMFVAFRITPERKRGDKLPTILTSIGILGTFMGIFIGLWNFNVNAVQESIPQLLEGLKIAFMTSIVGIFSALIIKYIYILRVEKEETGKVTNATIDTLAELLEKQNNTITDSFKNIEKSLVGDGDTTIITQLQKLRTTLIDKEEEYNNSLISGFGNLNDCINKNNITSNEIIKNEFEKQNKQNNERYKEFSIEFKELSNSLKENFSNALIEALEMAIKDFTEKLTDQFGENFKQLNIAVGKLLEWQEKYKEQMITLIDKFDKSVSNLTKISNVLDEISDHLQTVMEFVDELDGFIKTTDVHLKQLQKNIDAYADMADKAKKAFPFIYNKLDELTDGLSKSVNDAIERSQKSTETFRTAVEEQSTFINEYALQMKKDATKIMNGIDDRVQELMTNNAKILQKQVWQLDKDLQDELNKSLGSFGNQLVSISNRFAEHYTPLANKLKEVIEIVDDGNKDTRS